MKATKAVRDIMVLRQETVTALADKLKIKSNVLSERLRQENISIAKLEEMLELMDYKIVLVPKETEEQAGWYRIE